MGLEAAPPRPRAPRGKFFQPFAGFLRHIERGPTSRLTYEECGGQHGGTIRTEAGDGAGLLPHLHAHSGSGLDARGTWVDPYHEGLAGSEMRAVLELAGCGLHPGCERPAAWLRGFPEVVLDSSLRM